MNQRSQSAHERIRAVFDRVISDGLRRASVEGASEEQIDRMAAKQQVACVPEAAREVLRLIGVRSGLWFAGTAFGVDAMKGQYKQHAIATLKHLSHTMADPEGLLALTAHQGYAYEVVDGADLDQDDPPVWSIVEGETATKMWDSVSQWFAAVAPDLARLRETLKMRTKMGKRLPGWARDIEPHGINNDRDL